jgi:hypothetical protein
MIKIINHPKNKEVPMKFKSTQILLKDQFLKGKILAY